MVIALHNQQSESYLYVVADHGELDTRDNVYSLLVLNNSIVFHTLYSIAIAMRRPITINIYLIDHG